MFSLPIPTTQPDGTVSKLGRAEPTMQAEVVAANTPMAWRERARAAGPQTAAPSSRRTQNGLVWVLQLPELWPGWRRQRGSSRGRVQLPEECGEEKVTHILNWAGQRYGTGFSSWDTAQGIPAPAGKLAISG